MVVSDHSGDGALETDSLSVSSANVNVVGMGGAGLGWNTKVPRGTVWEVKMEGSEVGINPVCLFYYADWIQIIHICWSQGYLW